MVDRDNLTRRVNFPLLAAILVDTANVIKTTGKEQAKFAGQLRKDTVALGNKSEALSFAVTSLICLASIGFQFLLR